jgi:hypothetical protein
MSKIIGLGWLAATLLVATPIYAHEVEISGEVGATLHIEPNDRAKAGEPTQVWFALTEKGGRVIPLSECDCKLEVNAEQHKEGSPPLLEPPLKGIVAEQYQGIPSANLTFPKVGEYELELSGSPKATAKFLPFKLSYKVVVAEQAKSSQDLGKETEAKPTESTKQLETDKKPEASTKVAKIDPEQKPTDSPWWIIPIGIALTVGIVSGAIWLLKSNRD